MRIGNLNGRLVIVRDDLAFDIATASGGRFGPDPQGVYDDWAGFVEWAATAGLGPGEPFTPGELGAPSPRPTQVFAIGLNYRAHAAEANFEAPGQPAVFTKFQSAITGPYTTVEMPPEGHVDWEVELVAVIGRRARRVRAADAWGHVAGLTIGQDLSERIRQLDGPAPQFSLGKSFLGFAPMGPSLVTIDELPDPDDLAISCELDGETLQSARTSQMIFSVPVLIEHLSEILELYPGDVIFTGTPSGVGAARDPQRFIQAGQTLTSRIEGIGEIRQTFRVLQPS